MPLRFYCLGLGWAIWHISNRVSPCVTFQPCLSYFTVKYIIYKQITILISLFQSILEWNYLCCIMCDSFKLLQSNCTQQRRNLCCTIYLEALEIKNLSYCSNQDLLFLKCFRRNKLFASGKCEFVTNMGIQNFPFGTCPHRVHACLLLLNARNWKRLY